MLEVLDLPDIRKQVAPISIERYHRMIDLGLFDDWNVELINGVLIQKLSKTPLHVFIVLYLFDRLIEHCSESTFQVRKEDPITIGDSEPEPDISVVEGPRSRFIGSNPTTAQFIVEVAISTLTMDRTKSGAYASANVPEYWIVCPNSAKVEIHRKPQDGKYTENEVVTADSTIHSSALPGLVFNLEAALSSKE